MPLSIPGRGRDATIDAGDSEGDGAKMDVKSVASCGRWLVSARQKKTPRFADTNLGAFNTVDFGRCQESTIQQYRFAGAE